MTPTTAVTRLELGSTFEEFSLKMNQKKFIGAMVLPVRPVSVSNANIGKVPLKQLLTSANNTTRRAAGAGYARDTFTFDLYSYACQEYGKEEPLDDSQVAMYGDLIDAEQTATNRAEDAVLNEYERDVASAVFNTITFTGGLTTALATKWSSHATATPISDVQTACEAVTVNSGLEPNALILNKTLWRDLVQCDDIVDKLKFTVTPTQNQIRDALAELLGIEKILVAGGLKNAANEGQAASISRIWDSTMAMVARVAETDDPREPCLGRTFIWTGDGPSAPGDGGALATIAEEYREEKTRGTVFRARNNRDIQVMYAEAGYLLTNAR